MDFITAVRRCLLEKYADFDGRASRPEFWWFVLFTVIVNVVGDGLGFDVTDNAATILRSDGATFEVARGPKQALADRVWDLVVPLLAGAR